MKTELESGRWAKHGRGYWIRYLLRSTGAPIIVGYEYKALGRFLVHDRVFLVYSEVFHIIV